MPQPSAHVSGAPAEVKFAAGQLPTGQPATIPMYTFDQLDQSNPTSLRNKTRFLLDKIGQDALPPLPVQKDDVLAWVIDVQIKVATAAGFKGVTPRALGVPDDWAPADVLSHTTGAWFGGDHELSSGQRWALAPADITLDKLQPAHRGLSFEENMHTNRQEAVNGFHNSRIRNQGGSFAGGLSYGQ